VFDLVNGIPAHPLFVHAPIVLISLTLVLGLVYVVVPPLRPRLGSALLLLAAVSPLSALFATVSGERLAARLGENDAIRRHEGFGEMTRNLAAVLLVLVLMLVVVDRLRVRRRRREETLAVADHPGRLGGRGGGGVWTAVSVLLSVLLLGVGGATGAYLYLAGDSGSRMVWEGTAER
jgi:uncharacterized membrane protein